MGAPLLAAALPEDVDGVRDLLARGG